MPSEPESRFYPRVVALATAAILGVAVWKILEPFITAILMVFMAAWDVFVVSGSDNVVRPLFISGRAQISTLPVFLGRAGGLSAFGPIGMVLGPVIVALVLALLRFAEESRQPPVTIAGADS